VASLTHDHSARRQTGARELTTAEKAEASMNILFEKAKNDIDSDEEERIKGDEEWSD
jgi:hypothetical protein